MYCRVTKACEHANEAVVGIGVDSKNILHMQDGTVLDSLEVIWTHEFEDTVEALGINNSGTMVAAGSSSGEIALITADSGNRTLLSGHKGGTLDLCFTRDSSFLVSSGQDGVVRCWSVRDACERKTFSCNGLDAPRAATGAWVDHVACSPLGGSFAAASGRSVFVGAVPEGDSGEYITTALLELPPLPATATGLVFLSDGRLATSYYGGVCVWTFEPGQAGIPIVKETTKLPYQGSLTSLSSSEDSKWIVAGAQEAKIRLWEAGGQGQAFEMGGYSGKVARLAFGGASLVTTGSSEPMIWDFRGAGPAGRMPIGCFGHTKATTAVAFQQQPPRSAAEPSTSREGATYMVSGAKDNLVLAWDVSKYERGMPNKCVPIGGSVGPCPHSVATEVRMSQSGIILAAYTTGEVVAMRLPSKETECKHDHGHSEHAGA